VQGRTEVILRPALTSKVGVGVEKKTKKVNGHQRRVKGGTDGGTLGEKTAQKDRDHFRN